MLTRRRLMAAIPLVARGSPRADWLMIWLPPQGHSSAIRSTTYYVLLIIIIIDKDKDWSLLLLLLLFEESHSIIINGDNALRCTKTNPGSKNIHNASLSDSADCASAVVTQKAS
jgi:hypothetical protein